MAATLVAACDPGEREARPYAGLWESDGFGLYLDVHGGEIDVYEHTAVSCLRVAAGSARGMSDVISLEGERLVLRDGGRTVAFDEIDALPADCGRSPDRTPPEVFAVAVATVVEHRHPAPDPGWRVEVMGLGAGLHPESTPEELYDALVAALGTLGDREVRLAPGGDGVPASWPPMPGIGIGLGQRWPSVWSGRAVAGEAAPGVAYFGVVRLVVETERDQRDLAAALDRALGGADAAIIDLRAASGGVEEAALQVATRFVPATGVVATLMARSGDRLVGAGELSVVPVATGAFAGPVVVLVGSDTSGAGELLARILGDLPGVVVVGEPTAGSPREPLVRALPNGWSLGIPNVDVLGLEGTSWVAPLIPDVVVPTTAEDLEAGADPGLEAALEVLQLGG